MEKKPVAISKATLLRLPNYLLYLNRVKEKGIVDISSTTIAEEMGFNPVQVRKDLALISSVSGRPKTGFPVVTLIEDLENFLGYNHTREAILVGVGGLGKALLSYEGFENFGIKIIAAFDTDLRIHGEYHGKPVLPVEKLGNLIARMHIRIGIITVPKDAAQEVADTMIAAGIKAIWNFAPAHISVPEGIVIKNEDLAASLALLSKSLKYSHTKTDYKK